MIESLMSEPLANGSWEEDALCRDYDSSMWLLSEDPVLNKRNFEEAEVICSQCPVFSECWDHATGTDQKVTMRAGAWPTEYREVGQKRAYPRDRRETGKRRKDTCKHGHDTTDPASRNQSGQCRACKRDRDRLAKQAKAV